MKKIAIAMFIVLGVSSTLTAKENIGPHRIANPATGPHRMYAGCVPSKSKADLDINNVRCPIFINGDMWWDLVGTAQYEVPAGSGKRSLFAGAIWIGGKDGAGNLKVAAQTYRQSGSDFWPGPIDTANITISNDVCQKYDQHYKITFSQVKDFVNYFATHGGVSGYPVPDIIQHWPATGDVSKNQGYYLAPFHDSNNDGIYNYLDGDYPNYNLSSVAQCGDYLLGDQTIWWVFNDVGNIHSETGSQYSIGLEIQAQAFAFSTNDEINNMTFYKYKIINRAHEALYQTYFGAWVDPDLGNAYDDYVGCDVKRGFGYCYNGDADDDGALGYGTNPPAIGLDFFEGPLADSADGIDNNRNGVVDEVGEQIIMSKFVYYNNDFSSIGNPANAQQYYNYMKGIWKDGQPLVYGGNGYQTPSPGGDTCDFMFPGDSDPTWWGTHGKVEPWQWSESVPLPNGTPNTPDDRRFLQTAGSFTLKPGAVNYITTGAVWARTSSGGPLASVKLVRLADDKAQILFDNCFKLVDGPDAPDLSIRELDREIIISLSNPPTSNNFKELYEEKDPAVTSVPNSKYHFEGYRIFQVTDPSVATTDLGNPDKARQIFQCDIKNGIAQIVNQFFQPDLNAFAPVEEVNGEDNGLRHTLRITTDAFATGTSKLVNHKDYYFIGIAYAYNADEQVFDPYTDGLSQPYISSRRNSSGGPVKVYTAIPHISAPEDEGLLLNTSFGDGPQIRRMNGLGNGYNLQTDRKTLDLDQDEVNQIIFSQSNNKIQHPLYQRARGPVDIRIYDPVKVVSGDFELWLSDTVASTGVWYLKNIQSGKIDTSEKTIEAPYDQLFPEYGFYVSINQVIAPGAYMAGGNGFIDATLTYTDGNKRWMTFVPDIDNFPTYNWILSGTSTTAAPPDIRNIDNNQFYEKVLGGTWAPFRLVNSDTTLDKVAPAPLYESNAALNLDNLSYLTSVDVVITSDKSKWSRCVVFEETSRRVQAEGRQYKNLIRKHPSLNLDGTYSTTDSGYSWFPGYAIDVESGERLNIAFGEDSYLCPDSGFVGETGNDMIFNPTKTRFDGYGRAISGGKHFLYVFGRKNIHGQVNAADTTYWGPAYDGCSHIHARLWGLNDVSATASKKAIREVWKDCMWVSCPFRIAGQDLLATDVKFRLRVARPYRIFTDDSTVTFNNYLPYYKFSTNGLVAQVGQTEVAKNALDLINVVPNPYYAYSSYEKNQLDNRIKVVNLPAKCTVSIFTANGTLVRKYNRDVPADNTDGMDYPKTNLETALEWDLKNTAGVPVASGMYLIHVDAPGIGERTVKWFGVMRPVDLDTF